MCVCARARVRAYFCLFVFSSPKKPKNRSVCIGVRTRPLFFNPHRCTNPPSTRCLYGYSTVDLAKWLMRVRKLHRPGRPTVSSTTSKCASQTQQIPMAAMIFSRARGATASLLARRGNSVTARHDAGSPPLGIAHGRIPRPTPSPLLQTRRFALLHHLCHRWRCLLIEYVNQSEVHACSARSAILCRAVRQHLMPLCTHARPLARPPVRPPAHTQLAGVRPLTFSVVFVTFLALLAQTRRSMLTRVEQNAHDAREHTAVSSLLDDSTGLMDAANDLCRAEQQAPTPTIDAFGPSSPTHLGRTFPGQPHHSPTNHQPTHRRLDAWAENLPCARSWTKSSRRHLACECAPHSRSHAHSIHT